MFSIKYTKYLIKDYCLEKFLSSYSGSKIGNAGTIVSKINYTIIENAVNLKAINGKVSLPTPCNNFIISKLKPLATAATSAMKSFYSDGKQPPTRFINNNNNKNNNSGNSNNNNNNNNNDKLNNMNTNFNKNNLRPSWTKPKNYYGILGIGRYSTIKEIKAAYYRLAKIYHPDATNRYNYDTNKKFQEISEAYEILSDDIKRYDYDRFGIVKKNIAEEYMVDDSSKIKNIEKIKNFNEILSDSSKINENKNYKFKKNISQEEMYKRIFGSNIKKNVNLQEIETPEKCPMNEEIVIPVTFIQAVRGVTKDISIAAKTVCKSCNNEGRETAYRPSPCKYCKGTGLQSISTGRYLMRTKCNFCKGSRYAVTNPCAICGGRGLIIERKRMTINIPIGVEDGDKISVQHPTENRQISIKFNVDNSEYFERDSYDIHSKAEVLLSQALLGGIVVIKGIYGDITMKIPPGTTSHSKIRLLGKGLKKTKSNTTFGDHIVTVIVKMPTVLSTRQRALITAFAEIEGQISEHDKKDKTNKMKNELNKLHTINYEKFRNPIFKWSN